jgi:hypothetical protein
MELKIIKWKCSKCGKEIKSLYKNQFSFWKKQHELSHEVKDEN